MQRFSEIVIQVILVAVFFFVVSANAAAGKSRYFVPKGDLLLQQGGGYCLSWRTAVEAGNVRSWRTVPTQCLRHVESYMIGGQYNHDLSLIMDTIFGYLDEIVISDDGMDGWILDVDDTCISNVFYYRAKRFG